MLEIANYCTKYPRFLPKNFQTIALQFAPTQWQILAILGLIGASFVLLPEFAIENSDHRISLL